MKYLFLLSTLILSFHPYPSSGQQNIQAAIKRLAGDPALKHAGLGVCVIDLTTGRMVAGHAPDRSLIPASSLKLLSTATAFNILGKDFRYQTDLQIQGSVNAEGILEGNVIIKGSGDPSLGSPEWDEAAGFETVIEKFKLALQQKGIRKIDGYIIGDDSYFSTAVIPKTWTFNDLGNYYAAGVHGLNLHDNLYYLSFRQVGQLGATPPVYSVVPSIPELHIVNEIESAGKYTGDNAYIYGIPFTYLRYIRGSIPVGSRLFKIKGSIPDPPLFAAQQLEAALRQSGIEATMGATSHRLLAMRQATDNRPLQTLTTQPSPPLARIIERTLFKSVNLYAEALLHTIGKKQKGEGHTDAGLEAVYDFWESQNIDMGAAFLEDGSGLSPKNSISSRLMAQILYRMSGRKDFEAFRAAIPQGGRTGNLSRKFRGAAAEGRIWAKSGTLARVRTYAGYAKTKSGKQYSFAIFLNNYSGRGSVMRQKLDQFLIELCR